MSKPEGDSRAGGRGLDRTGRPVLIHYPPHPVMPRRLRCCVWGRPDGASDPLRRVAVWYHLSASAVCTLSWLALRDARRRSPRAKRAGHARPARLRRLWAYYSETCTCSFAPKPCSTTHALMSGERAEGVDVSATINPGRLQTLSQV